MPFRVDSYLAGSSTFLDILAILVKFQLAVILRHSKHNLSLLTDGIRLQKRCRRTVQRHITAIQKRPCIRRTLADRKAVKGISR